MKRTAESKTRQWLRKVECKGEDIVLTSTKKATVNVPIKKKTKLKSVSVCSEVLRLDGRLQDLLGLNDEVYVEDILQNALLSPIREMTSSPGKRVRGKLVALAYRLLSNEAQQSTTSARRLRIGAEVLELIHAGSLIVDDIEDGSRVRRGISALHVRYGLPIALNAGNWLYFWPLQLVKDLELPAETTLTAYQYYHRTLLRAHFGQALDLGTRVDTLGQNRVSEVCSVSLALKTGALMGFAMVMGGLIAGAEDATTMLLDDFGRELGVALQMFDDIGNITGAREPLKKYEDFTLRRPSWAWAWAAMNSSPEEYARFVDAVRKLPDADALEEWFAKHELIKKARASAYRHLEQTFASLKMSLDTQWVPWSKRAFENLQALGEEIAIAYE
jgi:geranylgeranyl pyrophosphate synthase